MAAARVGWSARFAAIALVALGVGHLAPAGAAAQDDERQVGVVVGQRVDGYRGIWHGQEPTRDEFHYKYSGGLATYTCKHIPMAVHAPAVRRTYFVYGGAKGEGQERLTGRQRLTAMIGVYDHASGLVERPTQVHDKATFDPHDNPSLSLDGDGNLWVVISGRGRGRPGWTYRSVEPYSIEQFELVDRGEYTYPQIWYRPPGGFLLLFTKYLGGRQLFFKTSDDGRTWSDDVQLAAFGGHYQLSWPHGERVGTVFNWHPGGNVDKRTNLYYAETSDRGRTWYTIDGRRLELPLTEVDNAALMHDFAAEGKLTYLNDMKYDEEGRPVVFIVVSERWQPGPGANQRWTVAHWDGREWLFHDVGPCDHNYDKGLVEVTPERWRVLGPSEPGPQPFHTGGDLALWESTDEGRTWTLTRQITGGDPYNHTYVRPVVDADDEFFAYWADGNSAEPSPCRLYFANHDLSAIWQLPEQMEGPTARPTRYQPSR